MAVSSQQSKSFYNWVLLLICIGVVVFVNIIGTLVYSRVDMTEDERYSLSKGSIEFLKNMNPADAADKKKKKKATVNRLYVKIYLEGNLPAEIKRFRNAIEDKLLEFKEFAGDRIEYEFIDPSLGSETDKELLYQKIYNKAKGIVPLEITYQNKGSQSQMLLWPGAEIEYAGVIRDYVQFLPGSPQGQPMQLSKEFSENAVQNSINNLEYMLISSLRRSIQQSKPRIAFIHGHGELSFAETMRVRSLISPYYSVEDITLNDSIAALKDVSGVVIARPRTPYSGKDLYILDQFVMQGGSLMCFMDKLTFPIDTLNMKGTVHTVRTNLGLDRMLFDYGIKTNDNYAMDASCGPISLPFAQQSLQPWFYYITARPTKHPIARNLEPVMLRYASQIQLETNPNRLATPLLTTSTNSTVSGLAPLVSLGMLKNFDFRKVPQLNENPTSEANKICLAGMVEGKFDSHFKNRIIEAFAKNKDAGFLPKSKKEGKVLVVANGSFIANYYDSMPNKLGGMQYRPIGFNNLRFDEVMAQQKMQPLIYGNQEFFQNMVDYLLGDNSVLDIRSKQIDIHPIDKEKVKADGKMYQFINLILPSGIVFLFAFLVFYLRRRRFARS